MKYNCELIRDLLPLYHDHVCSAQSRQAVDEHLRECEGCRTVLDDLNTEMLPGIEEAKSLNSIKATWNKQKRKSFMKGWIIAFSLALIVAAGKYVLTDWHCIPMGKDELVVVDVFQTSDGMINVLFSSLYDLHPISSGIKLGKDGCEYIEFYRPILAKKLNAYSQDYTTGSRFTPELLPKFKNSDGDSSKLERVYLGVSGEPENSILVWEDGMKIRQATEEENERFGYYSSDPADDAGH